MKKSLREISMGRLQLKPGEDVSKKKSAKEQLKEAQEELRKEKEARETLEQEKSSWGKERNFWITELKKMEELRQAEARFSEVLRYQEAHKANAEKDVERQKLLADLEEVRRQRDEVDRQKLEIEGAWREAADSWVHKISGLTDALEEKTEEIEKLRSTVEELHSQAPGESDATCTDLIGEDKQVKRRPVEKWKGWYSNLTSGRKTQNSAWSCCDFASVKAAGCSSGPRHCRGRETTQLRDYTELESLK